jgi:transcriptional regulator with XRE-family HTH domain
MIITEQKQTLLSDRISQLLREKNVRKVDLARATGSPRATISDWTNGKTTFLTYDKLTKAAKFLGVNAEWLQNGKGDKYPLPKWSELAFPEPEQLKPAPEHRAYENALFDICDELIDTGCYSSDKHSRSDLYHTAHNLAWEHRYPPLTVIRELLVHLSKTDSKINPQTLKTQL